MNILTQLLTHHIVTHFQRHHHHHCPHETNYNIVHGNLVGTSFPTYPAVVLYTAKTAIMQFLLVVVILPPNPMLASNYLPPQPIPLQYPLTGQAVLLAFIHLSCPQTLGATPTSPLPLLLPPLVNCRPP